MNYLEKPGTIQATPVDLGHDYDTRNASKCLMRKFIHWSGTNIDRLAQLQILDDVWLQRYSDGFMGSNIKVFQHTKLR